MVGFYSTLISAPNRRLSGDGNDANSRREICVVSVQVNASMFLFSDSYFLVPGTFSARCVVSTPSFVPLHRKLYLKSVNYQPRLKLKLRS